MQAIITKYLCPTNFKGSRITAKCEAMRITLSWDDALNPQENHIAAASELCKRIDDRNTARYGAGCNTTAFRGRWALPKVCGQIHSGEYAHVFVGDA